MRFRTHLPVGGSVVYELWSSLAGWCEKRASCAESPETVRLVEYFLLWSPGRAGDVFFCRFFTENLGGCREISESFPRHLFVPKRT